MKIGQPRGMLLSQFGDVLQQAFACHDVYHVGSSLLAKETWRDVDVRVLLSDEAWEKLGLLEPQYNHMDPKWRSLCIVFSHYGQHLTGLPIDFQIQRIDDANKEFSGGIRSWLGTYDKRKED